MSRKLRKKSQIKQRENTSLDVSGTCCFVSEDGGKCRNKVVTADGYCKKHMHDRSLVIRNKYPLATKYDSQSHPFLYIEYAMQGLSKLEICKEMKISKGTLVNWIEAYPDFAEAFDIAETAHEADMTAFIRNNMTNSHVQSPLIKLYMKNRFDWREQEHQQNVQQINQQNIGIAVMPRKMSMEEWEASNVEYNKQYEDADIVE